MRTFSITYSVPGTCDCCGAALAVAPGGASAGAYKIELPEGDTPTEVKISEAASVTLSKGKLVVRLRQARGSNRQWAVKPLYNPGAFAKERSRSEHPQGDGDFYFYVFEFELPDYQPNFSTWWAELTFMETPWGARALGGSLAEAHNAATLKVRLLNLA